MLQQVLPKVKDLIKVAELREFLQLLQDPALQAETLRKIADDLAATESARVNAEAETLRNKDILEKITAAEASALATVRIEVEKNEQLLEKIHNENKTLDTREDDIADRERRLDSAEANLADRITAYQAERNGLDKTLEGVRAVADLFTERAKEREAAAARVEAKFNAKLQNINREAST